MCNGDQTRESDAELVRRLQQGDASTFDELFHRHQRAMLGYVTGILHDRGLAEDVVQDAFLRLVRCRKQIDPRRGVSSWLYRVARNRAIDVIRKRRREVSDEQAGDRAEAEGTEASPHRPDRDLVAQEEGRCVREAMTALPEREREVLQLRFFGDRSFREIAEITGRPLGTVLWQGHSGLKRLRKTLAAEDEGAAERSDPP